MTLTTLLYIALVIYVLCILWQQMGISQRALQAALASSAKHGVTLLDQSIFLKNIGFSKIKNMQWPTLNRTYEFEFSTLGDRRYKGWVFMRGSRITSVQLQPFAE